MAAPCSSVTDACSFVTRPQYKPPLRLGLRVTPTCASTVWCPTPTRRQKRSEPLGTYNLILEALNGFDDYVYQINLRFVPSAAAGFGLLKRGAEIQTDEVLTTTAELAG